MTDHDSNRNGLWQSLGKKTNAGSASALPGAMSSTTAHGVLPQYAGSAAASLSPAMSVGGGGALLATSSSPGSSPIKAQKQAENGGNSLQGEYKPALSPR